MWTATCWALTNLPRASTIRAHRNTVAREPANRAIGAFNGSDSRSDHMSAFVITRIRGVTSRYRKGLGFSSNAATGAAVGRRDIRSTACLAKDDGNKREKKQHTKKTGQRQH